MLSANMLVTNTGGRDAHEPLVDAEGDMPGGRRRQPGPHDLEHRAASHLGGAACGHRGPAVARGRLLARLRRGHAARRGDRRPPRPQAAAAGRAVFLAASLWCALSVSAGELIAARAVMGLGAGIVFPMSLAVVSAAFGEDDRPTAIGILTAAVALALPLGPVLGGLLLEHFSWHSVFWINVPVVCLALVAGAS